jgi:hypothetical protein
LSQLIFLEGTLYVATIKPSDTKWFISPGGYVSHIAWCHCQFGGLLLRAEHDLAPQLQHDLVCSAKAPSMFCGSLLGFSFDCPPASSTSDASSAQWAEDHWLKCALVSSSVTSIFKIGTSGI